ncbi:HlyD family efflux transporter periplasmic adaptor subunit [Bordetella petrii]|nr:HlyD family efflux transporter periplasmic adaptor subunit [Bordetella petrii]
MPNTSPSQPTRPQAPGPAPGAAGTGSGIPARTRRSRRRKGFLALAALVAIGAACWWAWQYFVAAGRVATDNAYVHGNVVVVTPQVSGTVVRVNAEEAYPVAAGQLLVALDATDAVNRLQRKTAQLAQTVRDTQALYLETDALHSEIAVRLTRVARARAELARAADSVRRRQPLRAAGAVSSEELRTAQATLEFARSEVAAAEAGLAQARERLRVHRALIDNVPVDAHPAIRLAAIEMREAWLALKRAEVRAPVAGHVVNKHVQVGQRVTEGANLMSIVPLDQLWVEANFKESQLRNIRNGQPVRLYADLYGNDIRYDGWVAGVGAGTGAAFSLLPAQNATGNWIKIMQRVPVRIALDPRQLKEHPLRMGLSMRAVVDTRRGGDTVAAAPPPQASSTDIFAELEQGADVAVRAVIDAHLASADTGSPAAAASRPES